jgi:hypothetical protein
LYPGLRLLDLGPLLVERLVELFDAIGKFFVSVAEPLS